MSAKNDGESAQDARNGDRMTCEPSGHYKTRLRAFIALLFHEAGEPEPPGELLDRLADAADSSGLTIRPLVTRW